MHPQDINPHYGDVYARGGLEEKRYTFLALQNLPARMAAYQNAATHTTPPFTIAELATQLELMQDGSSKNLVASLETREAEDISRLEHVKSVLETAFDTIKADFAGLVA